MKTQTTRTSPPNYGLIVTAITSAIFWIATVKILFGAQIKAWMDSLLSMIL